MLGGDDLGSIERVIYSGEEEERFLYLVEHMVYIDVFNVLFVRFATCFGLNMSNL